MSLRVVLLPLPEGPTIATFCPGKIVNDMPFSSSFVVGAGRATVPSEALLLLLPRLLLLVEFRPSLGPYLKNIMTTEEIMIHQQGCLSMCV